MFQHSYIQEVALYSSLKSFLVDETKQSLTESEGVGPALCSIHSSLSDIDTVTTVSTTRASSMSPSTSGLKWTLAPPNCPSLTHERMEENHEGSSREGRSLQSALLESGQER